MRSSVVEWGARNETVMEAEASAIPTLGTGANPGGQPRRLDTQLRERNPSSPCAHVHNDVLRVLHILCVSEYRFPPACGGIFSACSALCACYVVYVCFAYCACATRFQNLMWNTVGYKSAPQAKNIQMVDKGIWSHSTYSYFGKACVPCCHKHPRVSR